MEIFYYNGRIYAGYPDENGVPLPTQDQLDVTDGAILSVINFIHGKNVTQIKLDSIDKGYLFNCSFEEVDNQETLCYNDQVDLNSNNDSIVEENQMLLRYFKEVVMKIRCPTCGKLIGLNLETVSILGKMLNKIDYEQEQVVIPSGILL